MLKLPKSQNEFDLLEAATMAKDAGAMLILYYMWEDGCLGRKYKKFNDFLAIVTKYTDATSKVGRPFVEIELKELYEKIGFPWHHLLSNPVFYELNDLIRERYKR